MARILKTSIKTSIGARLTNYFKSGKPVSVELYPDDTVTDLAYIEKEEVKKVSGRLSSVSTVFVNNSATRQPTYSFLNTDAKVSSLTIDLSEPNKSHLVTVKIGDILSIGDAQDVEDVRANVIIKSTVEVTLSDGTTSSLEFKEGAKMLDSVVLEDGREVQGNFTVKSFLYTGNYSFNVSNNRGEAEVIGVVLGDDNGKLFKAAFTDFKLMGKSVVATNATEVTKAIEEVASSPDKGGVSLPASKVEEALTLKDKITIIGNKSEVPASSGTRATNTIADDETVISNTLSISDNATVELNGVAITEKALVNLGQADKLVMRNTKIVGLTPDNARAMGITGTWDKRENSKGTKLDIQGCYFGDNSTDGTKSNIYNFMELNTLVADGSIIKDNYFTEKAQSHNTINFYNVADGATVTVENNHFEKSANAIRVGCIGNKKATFNFINNKFDKTDDMPWDGLCMIQPYGKQTESMKNITINLQGNKGPCKHMIYVYYNGNNVDTVMDESTLPTVIENGKNITKDLQILHN